MSTIQVLYTAKTRDTGEALARELDGGDPIRGILNWTGGPIDPYLLPTLNAKAFTDKLQQLMMLEEAGVSVPRFALPRTKWAGGLQCPHPGWLPRTRFHHACNNFIKEVAQPDFFVEPLIVNAEWRLHVGRTKRDNMRILRSSRRVPTDGAHPWVHSFDLGWRWKFEEVDDEIKVLARQAMRALNLDLGAVDVVAVPDSDNSSVTEFCVLEVNTCPGLADEPETLRRYVEFIKEQML